MTTTSVEVWVSHDGQNVWVIDDRGWLNLGVGLGKSMLRKRSSSTRGMNSGCGPGHPRVCTNGCARLATEAEKEKLRKFFINSAIPF